MFTRVLEFTAKQGKAREVSSVLNDKVLPMLKNQPFNVDISTAHKIAMGKAA